jgi:hypothetical protein
MDAGRGTGRTDAPVDAHACSNISVTAADLECASDRDCVAGYSGEFCAGECWACYSKNTPMNAAAAAGFENELGALSKPGAVCPPCPMPPSVAVECAASRCIACPRGIDGTPECGDAGGTPLGRDAGGDATTDATFSLDAPGELDAATPVDDAGGCTSSVVEFRLTAPSSATWLIGGSDNSDAPGANWLTFFLPSGVQLFTSAGETLNLDCRSCSAMFPYGFGAWSAELPDAGVTGKWNGFAYVAGACGPSGTACLTPLCMPPGPYIAKMCAKGASTGTPLTCVDVPFEYPTTETVTGELP